MHMSSHRHVFTRLDDLILALSLPKHLSTGKGIIIIVFIAVVIIVLIPTTSTKFDYVCSNVAVRTNVRIGSSNN